MQESNERKIRPVEISEWLRSEDKKAAWLAKTMGVTPATVSRWINGKVAPSSSDEAILKMLIRGEMPFDLIGAKSLHGVLDFTSDQWRVIEILARRESTTPGKWIAGKIRAYLAYDQTAREIQSHLTDPETSGNPIARKLLFPVGAQRG